MFPGLTKARLGDAQLSPHGPGLWGDDRDVQSIYQESEGRAERIVRLSVPRANICVLQNTDVGRCGRKGGSCEKELVDASLQRGPEVLDDTGLETMRVMPEREPKLAGESVGEQEERAGPLGRAGREAASAVALTVAREIRGRRRTSAA